MYKEIKCARCGNTLEFVKQAGLQLGKETLFFDRDYEKSYILTDIYLCPECGEYHFFKYEPIEREKSVKCKWCCKTVDPNYPCCPACGYKEGEKWWKQK